MTVRTQPSMMLGSARNAGHKAVGVWVFCWLMDLSLLDRNRHLRTEDSQRPPWRVFQSRDTKTWCGTWTASEQSSNFGGWNVVFFFWCLCLSEDYQRWRKKRRSYLQVNGLLVSKSHMSPLNPLTCCNSTNQVTSSSRTLIALAAFMPSTRFKGGPGAITHHRIMSSSPHPPTLPSSLGCLSAGLGRCRVPADSGSLCRVQFCNTAWLERTGQMTPKTAFM